MKTYPYPTPDGITQLVEESEYNRLKWKLEESKAMHAADVSELNARLTQQQSDMLDTIVQLRAEFTSWQLMAAQYSAEREHNANMAGMWQALAERLAMTHKKIVNKAIWPDKMRMCSIEALAAYESAKKGEHP